MSYKQKRKKLDDNEARRKSMILWRKRFVVLKKKHGITAKEFSREHGFNNTYLSHQMSGRRGSSEEYFNKVEKLLKRYGV